MRRFGRKQSTPTLSGAAAAEAEAEAELRRAAEALGMPGAAAAWQASPAELDVPAEEAVVEAVPVGHETDPEWEDAQVSTAPHAGDDGDGDDVDVVDSADLRSEGAPGAPLEGDDGPPARRRVRKSPPGAADAGRRDAVAGSPSRVRASGRSAGTP